MKKFLLLLTCMLCTQLSFAKKEQIPSDYNAKKAQELIAEFKFDEAMQYLDKQLQETPNNADVYILKVFINIYQDEFSSALYNLNNALKCWSKRSKVTRARLHWWKADIYTQIEENNRAGVEYDEAIELSLKEEPGITGEIIEDKANFLYNIGKYDMSDKCYHLLYSKDETNVLALVGLARNQIARGNYKDAISYLNKCELYDKSYSEIYRIRMQAYEKNGEIDKAIDDAISWIEKDENASYSSVKGLFEQHIGYAVACVTFKMNTAENYEDKMSWRVWRMLLYESGFDYQNALEDLNVIMKENSYHADASFYYSKRAEYYANLGHVEEAIEDITKSMEMSEGTDRNWYQMIRGQYYRDGGMYSEAIVDFTKSIENYPKSAYPYYARGWCYELSGNKEKAMKDYNVGIDVNKEYPYIYLMRGELYMGRGEMEKAKADFNEVLKQDTIVEYGTCRQYALHFLGKDDEALIWMDSLISKEPKNPGHWYDKSCLLARMNKKQESLKALRMSFDLGYRKFAHIKYDDDMDPIRDLQEFKDMIEEYKNKPFEISSMSVSNNDEVATISEVEMKRRGGTYEIPCSVNGVSLTFIFDTGASSVSISSVEASFMLKNGYLKPEDIKGKEYFGTATGAIHEGTIINLREVKIGEAVLRNVQASVVDNQNAPLLLGQTVLERFGTITIDNINSKLFIKQ